MSALASAHTHTHHQPLLATHRPTVIPAPTPSQTPEHIQTPHPHFPTSTHSCLGLHTLIVTDTFTLLRSVQPKHAHTCAPPVHTQNAQAHKYTLRHGINQTPHLVHTPHAHPLIPTPLHALQLAHTSRRSQTPLLCPNVLAYSLSLSLSHFAHPGAVG